MEPQTMAAETFFKKLCEALELDIEESDEFSVLWAIEAMKINLEQAEKASGFHE